MCDSNILEVQTHVVAHYFESSTFIGHSVLPSLYHIGVVTMDDLQHLRTR